MTLTQQREIVDHGLTVLGAFLGDYTDPDEDGHRALVIVVGGSVSDGYFDVEAHRSPRDELNGPPLRFRVSLMIAPAPYPVEPLVDISGEASSRGGRSLSSRDASGLVRPVPGAGHRA